VRASTPAHRNLNLQVLYQGTTSVVPKRRKKRLGFNP